ncbi:MAG: RNA-directed DNA polymerase [Flavobacterium lindanitolerans]|uniref:reverse transcriptase family protein n=1 Tax=Flavobacterium lindanitolerans TaxID=428988 RepID=UPI001A4D0D4C|nr:reverse transcriptase family protein [Flavobacterium lindanitolerans]MBL7868478.1 RNA-directed DNA polymerase [Flavobacterium lindanitolerans]
MNFPRNTYLELANTSGKSPEFIESTLNYADNLIHYNLPVIFSLKHFSQIIGVDFHQLLNVIENRGHYYSYYLIKKRKGGYRRIIAPHKNIRYLQDWIKINILDKVKIHSSATGFTKGKSILDNAKSHLDSEVLLNIDLENFFESITEKRIYGVFKWLGYHKNLAIEFAKICTVKMPEEKFDNLNDISQEYFFDYYLLKEAVLVQGAPTSPSLSNIICIKLDNRFNKLANKRGISYSRYADDITFSGNKDSLPSYNLVKKIIESENLKINWTKVGRYKKGQKQVVTGLLVNENIRVPKKFKKEVLRHLFFCEKYGAASHFNRIAPDKSFRKEWLIGKILYINSIEPEVAKSMFERIKKISWEI